MRIICNGHAKTPIEFYYLETGATPLKQIISSRRIMYLHNILSREDSELVKRVYVTQRDNPTSGDFVELVKSDLEDINIEYIEKAIIQQSKTQLKLIIKEKLKASVLKKLKDKQSSHSKIRDITYNKLQIQPYMASNKFTNEMVQLIFNFRSSMIKNVKANFSSINRNNMWCKLKCQDEKEIDSQQHLLGCKVLLKELKDQERESLSNVVYDFLFGSLEQQRQVALVLGKLLEIRDKLLENERLPVGLNTGPISTITTQ